ncbi:MAG: CHASE2 domain-containing protein [Gammaproteobacteria bacterium]|nr:CHASE2 domain-containing protein [Gammaproteobacteria bacterium]
MPGGTYLRLAVLVIAAGAWVAATAWSVGRASDVSWLLWLEHWTGDFRTALLSHRPKRPHERVALITIDDDTMQPYIYRSPIDRRLLASLVSAIDKAGAKAIGLDFLFLKATEKRKDEELIEALRKARARIVVASADKRVDIRPAQADYQRRFLKETGATGGYANLLTGKDRVVRYVAAPADPAFPKSFAVALAKPGAAPPGNGPRRIAWMLNPYDGNERFLAVPAHFLVTPDGKQTPVAPALLSKLKDKIVIIGADFPDIDRHQIPMLTWRGEADEVAGMLIHAQIAAQLVDGRTIEHVDRNVLLAIFAILAAVGLMFGLRHGFVAVSLYATTASVLMVLADMISFHFLDQIIPFGASIMAIILGLVGGLVLRRFRIFFLKT